MEWDIKHHFLSVMVRTHKRPKAVRECLNSLRAQTKRNFIVVLISDCKEDNVEKLVQEYPDLSFRIKHVEPLGYPGCNLYFNQVRDSVNSDYIVFIDDDDKVVDENYFEALEHIAIKENPGVIMSRLLFIKGRILPSERGWKNPPEQGYVSALNFCVRCSIYQKCDWPDKRYGDYHFIFQIYNSIDWEKEVYWHDKITTAIQDSPRHGKGEEE